MERGSNLSPKSEIAQQKNAAIVLPFYLKCTERMARMCGLERWFCVCVCAVCVDSLGKMFDRQRKRERKKHQFPIIEIEGPTNCIRWKLSAATAMEVWKRERGRRRTRKNLVFVRRQRAAGILNAQSRSSGIICGVLLAPQQHIFPCALRMSAHLENGHHKKRFMICVCVCVYRSDGSGPRMKTRSDPLSVRSVHSQGSRASSINACILRRWLRQKKWFISRAQGSEWKRDPKRTMPSDGEKNSTL